jgi:septal ring factor EnvC (AmiA/AmiB activator)
MARPYKILGFIVVLVLGVYGCTKAPNSSPTTENGTPAAKVQKLEKDYAAAVTAREEMRQKLVAAEQAQQRLEKELTDTRAAAEKERDALKAELTARTKERDALQIQYEAFRKNLKELIGNADAAVSKLNLPPPQVSIELGAQK